MLLLVLPTLRQAASLLVIALLALACTAEAQRGPRGGDPAERIAQLAEALDLSDAQVEQLQALFEEQRADRPERGSRDRDAMRAEFERRRAALEREIEAILTPEQVETLRQMRADRRHERRRGDGS